MLSKRFLLVEDDLDDQVLFLEIFHDVAPGCICNIVNNGLEALDYLSRITPDLIVTDINMPKMGGAEFIRIIKTELNLSVPMIVWSTKPPTPGLASELGITAAFAKPYDVEHLYTFIEEIVSIAAGC